MTRLFVAALLLGPLWFGSLWVEAARPALVARFGPAATATPAPVAAHWDVPLGTPGPQPTTVVRVEVVDRAGMMAIRERAGLPPPP